MTIKIVYAFAPIFFKCVRTCLFYRKQSYFSDFVGDKHESGASDRKLMLWTTDVLFSCFWLGPLHVLCVRAQEVEATNFLPFPGNGQNLTTVSFILASSTPQITTDNSLKLCILKPHVTLFYPLLDPMEDLLNVGEAHQTYWLWGVLGCTAWDTMSHPFRKKNLWSFSFRELFLPSVYYFHLLK